jgi:hypothetical protein
LNKVFDGQLESFLRELAEEVWKDAGKRLCEFLVHGLRYAFPPEWSGITRGVPTSYAAPPLSAQFAEGDLPPVWPHSEGTARGEGLAPLYKSVPKAALRDQHLYEWLALVDAIRAGPASGNPDAGARTVAHDGGPGVGSAAKDDGGCSVGDYRAEAPNTVLNPPCAG